MITPHGPRFGVLGPILAAVGAGLVVVAFTVLYWVPQVDDAARKPNGFEVYRPARLYDVSQARHSVSLPTLTLDYVTWLGWTLLALAVVAALAASTPSAGTTWWRVVGAAAGLLGAFVTFRSVVDLLAQYPSSGAFGDGRATGFSDAHAGPYVALIGFLVCALGAAIAPLGAADRRDRDARTVRRHLGRLRTRLRPDRRAAASLAVTGGAAILLFLAFTAATWYHQGTDYDEPPDYDFAKLVNNAHDPLTGSLPHAYFPMLAWLLVVIALVALVAANAGTPLTNVLRLTATAAGIAGIVLTYLALRSFFGTANNPAGGHGVLPASRIGLWAVFAGFALSTVAAALAHDRRRVNEPAADPAGVGAS